MCLFDCSAAVGNSSNEKHLSCWNLFPDVSHEHLSDASFDCPFHTKLERSSDIAHARMNETLVQHRSHHLLCRSGARRHFQSGVYLRFAQRRKGMHSLEKQEHRAIRNWVRHSACGNSAYRPLRNEFSTSYYCFFRAFVVGLRLSSTFVSS